MPTISERWRRVVDTVRKVLVWTTTIAIVGTGIFLWLECSWAEPQFREPAEAFREGSIGTELLPLPALQVLPDMFPEYFQPAGPDAGDWIDQFGFLRDQDSEHGLPIGFTLSNYRPRSAAGSPVQFVGFACALCHTQRVIPEDGREPILVTGAGNASLHFIGFVHALRAATTDERFTAEAISDAYREKFGRSLGLVDRLIVRGWVGQIQEIFNVGATKYDDPWPGMSGRDPNNLPTGPCRTVPFQNLIRIVLDRPAAFNRGYSKFATVFQQKLKKWAQFDGSVGDLKGRSALAAFSAGATITNLKHPEIAHNVSVASEYVAELRGPRFRDLFPDQFAALDAESIQRGAAVYAQHCTSCHGQPDESGNWKLGPRNDEVVPLDEIRTDPTRVSFRYYEPLAQSLYEAFPDDHPLKFARDEIRPGPSGNTRGYVNGPIDSVFLRAPYLHNASILTLSELIHLEPRRAMFYRGRNEYDADRVGLKSPDAPDEQHYYRFDTSVPGNTAVGHDYPWPAEEAALHQQELQDLLAWLKTL